MKPVAVIVAELTQALQNNDPRQEAQAIAELEAAVGRIAAWALVERLLYEESLVLPLPPQPSPSSDGENNT